MSPEEVLVLVVQEEMAVLAETAERVEPEEEMISTILRSVVAGMVEMVDAVEMVEQVVRELPVNPLAFAWMEAVDCRPISHPLTSQASR